MYGSGSVQFAGASAGGGGGVGPQGPQGPTGPQGDPGTNAITGINYTGVYDNGAAYVVNDATNDGVTGDLYGCILATTGNGEPSTDPTHWQFILLAGAPGATGADGVSAGVPYLYQGAGPAGNPGAGQMASDAAMNLASELYIHNQDLLARDLSAYLATMDMTVAPVSAVLTLIQPANPGAVATFEVTGLLDNGVWLTISVNPLTVVGAWAGSEEFQLSIAVAGATGPTGAAGTPGADGADALSVVRSVAANDTATAADGILLGNATIGAYTQQFPDPVANVGKVFAVVKVDPSANAITVENVNGETGLTAYKLRKQFDAIMVVADGISTYSAIGEYLAPRAQMDEVTGGHSGTATDAQVVLLYVASVPRVIYASADPLFAESNVAQVGSAGGCIYSIRKNGVQVGTVTFIGPGNTSGVVSIAANISLAVDDVLTVLAPNPADASLEAYGITLQAWTVL
jgi:hypothetical protein